MFRKGAWLILFGYYKKVVLADNLAPFVNVVFADPSAAHGLAIPVAVLAFAIQIYGDFSGYTDIARGISWLMGFDLMENFRMPYFALSPKQFWQRWHISLSTWLRDYLYVPLGGNRLGAGRNYSNLMLTMILGGLWHGAAWNFVLWGLYQGILLVIYRASGWEIPLGRLEKQSTGPAKVMAWIAFMFLVGFGWMLFRVESIPDLTSLIQNIVVGPFMGGKTALLTIIVYGFPVLFLDLLQERKQSLLAVKQLPVAFRYGIYLTLFTLIVVSGVGGGGEFIYFQF
jgi:D-alanyl-lipoteichoic acid acyltransferase DltB (MBOAT superfamily)